MIFLLIADIFSVSSVLFIRARYFQAFKIPAGSMRMTLIEGDRILVSKSSKYVPQRGDVLVFVYPEDRTRDFVKRVIGLPGETIEIKDGKILINDHAIDDPRISKRYYYNYGQYGQVGQKVLIPEDSYYVLGDNSGSSKDSRYWGFVTKKDIIGKAFKVYWPINRSGVIK